MAVYSFPLTIMPRAPPPERDVDTSLYLLPFPTMNSNIISYHARVSKFFEENLYPPTSDCCNAFTTRVGDDQHLCLYCGELCNPPYDQER